MNKLTINGNQIAWNLFTTREHSFHWTGEEIFTNVELITDTIDGTYKIKGLADGSVYLITPIHNTVVKIES